MFLVLHVCKGKGLLFASKLTCPIQTWDTRVDHIVNLQTTLPPARTRYTTIPYGTALSTADCKAPAPDRPVKLGSIPRPAHSCNESRASGGERKKEKRKEKGILCNRGTWSKVRMG